MTNNSDYIMVIHGYSWWFVVIISDLSGIFPLAMENPPSATFDDRMVNFTNRDLIRDKQMGSMLHRLGYNIYNQKLEYKNHDTPIHRGMVINPFTKDSMVTIMGWPYLGWGHLGMSETIALTCPSIDDNSRVFFW